MKSRKSNNFFPLLQRVAEKLSDVKGTQLTASLYSGLTVGSLIEKLDRSVDEVLEIKVDRKKYNSLDHNHKLVKKLSVQQEMVKKEFKQKIIYKVDNVDDIIKIAPETQEFKSTFGYVVKIIINITTI